MAQHQARPLVPVAAIDDDLAGLAEQVMQQERPSAEDLAVLARQRRIGAEVDAGMVRMRRLAHRHDDHVPALWRVDLVEARRLEVLLV